MTNPTTFREIPEMVGRKYYSEAFTLTTDDVERFEQATWSDRALPDGTPAEYPTDIVEGFYLLSLFDPLSRFAGILDHETTWALNYGGDRVRFVAPIYLGDRVIPEFEILQVKPKGAGFLILERCTLTVEGAARPNVVADWWIFVQARK